jgi:hypothetical protein
VRSRRHIRRPPDLTSLFDVLFIVVFAALIRAAAVENAAAHPPAPPQPRVPETPPAVAALRQRALADLDAALAARTPVIVRITRDGAIEALEVDGKRLPLVAPLLEHDPDPDVRATYAGDRVPGSRVCRIAAQHLGVADLSRYLVIVAPAVAFVDLPQAVVNGLPRDVERCQSDLHGVAALVDPGKLAAPSPAATQPSTSRPATPPQAPQPGSSSPTPSSPSRATP